MNRVTSKLAVKLFFYHAFFMVILQSSGLRAQDTSDSLKLRVSNVLDQWHLDAASGNHTAYIGAMTADGVFIGTDASEYWSAAGFSTWSKPYFDKGKTWNFKPFDRNIYFSDNGLTAWFDELLETQMGVCRGSGVLQKKDGKWKIAQYVLSATIPNDIIKNVTAMKSAEDTLIVFRQIFKDAGMTGTMMILDQATGKYFGYNTARWDSGYLPASTFKIPNTLIGLETGVIDTGYIFKWNGVKRRLPQWDRDLSLRDAFRVSCVPCYQELARKTGLPRMNEYLAKIQYGRMDVHKENLDLFWLEGNSRITPRQQLDFVKRLHEETLPLKKSVMQSVKSIMINEVTPEYTLSGKTGWAIRNGNNYGWFVGWLETGGKVYYIATLVEPLNQAETDDFAAARKKVTLEVFRCFGIIKR